jgi:hypothetical protein
VAIKQERYELKNNNMLVFLFFSLNPKQQKVFVLYMATSDMVRITAASLILM